MSLDFYRFIKDAAESNGVSYRSYSGRAMYGRQCVGIVGHHTTLMKVIQDAIKEAAQEMFDAAYHVRDADSSTGAFFAKEEFDQFVETVMTYRSDNMGWDLVVYWPDVDWSDQQEDVIGD